MALEEFIASYIVGAADTDRVGLFELSTAIGTRRPELERDEIERACLSACTQLLRAGHVRVEVTPAGARRPGRGGYKKLAEPDAQAALDDPASWQPPSDAHPRYWLVATDAGREAYISEEVVSLL